MIKKSKSRTELTIGTPKVGYEADQRHAEVIVEEEGVPEMARVVTPGMKKLRSAAKGKSSIT